MYRKWLKTLFLIDLGSLATETARYCTVKPTLIRGLSPLAIRKALYRHSSKRGKVCSNQFLQAPKPSVDFLQLLIGFQDLNLIPLPPELRRRCSLWSYS